MKPSLLLVLVLSCMLQACMALRVPSDEGASQSNDAMIFKLNKGIDMMLSVARWVFTKHGELTLKLPDIGREFGHDVYKGWFNASGGSFRNIGSLHRTGDIAFVKANSSLSLEVALGLSELVAGYSNYTLTILKINQQGNMSLTVAENSLKMKLTFTYSPQCKFNLDELAFDKLDGVKVDIKGLGAFQMLYDQISKWLISNFEERFRIIANKKMREKLNKAVNENTAMICKWWPHF